ncbi:Polysaccharidase [[Actinomadura] parvosata subsp. kistnae]|uniref:right-handed parallel beta-helix repeat-containing protein n=1 Tax=[Actinomadura] parvosata TaxID=1955412 RepID=UPI000D2D24AD|nr:right-handed parallel beta-helix repeat-containing protein [Nonomuraea sp. ATCC 55076]SPL90518.1 Polysaccharidase [Actinomadura parvosata subsp. kistnae]
MGFTTFALMVAAGAATAPAAAAEEPATYYIDSVSGNDTRNGTSAATAWRTLAKANAATLVPGSKLLLRRGGSWAEQLVVTARESGTQERPIVIDAYGTGARPVIKGTDEDACVLLSGNHIEVYNLQVGVEGAGRCEWSGFSVEGDNNFLNQNYITGASAGVYIDEDADYTSINNNEFVNNNVMSVNTDASEMGEEYANDDSGAFGILVHGDDSEISWNEIRGSIALSFDYVFDGAAVEIFKGSRNYVHHNISVDNDTFTELGTLTSPDGQSQDPDGTADNVFEYNAVYGERTRGGMVTRGPFKEEAGSPVEPNGPVLRTVFRNNSIYLTHEDAEGVVCDASCTNEHLTMTQNAIYAKKKSVYAPGVTKAANSYNVLDGDQYQMADDGTGNVFENPRFDPANPLRLLSGSKAIGLGKVKYGEIDLNGVAIGTGGGIEAGAYEYTAG